MEDREGDIFEQFTRAPDERTFLLIRSSVNRHTSSNEKLWDRLSKAAVLGQYELHLSADSQRGLPSRTATIEVRCIVAEIKQSSHKKNSAQTVTVYAVEAKEINNELSAPIH